MSSADHRELFLHEAAHGYVALLGGSTKATIRNDGEGWSCESDLMHHRGEADIPASVRSTIAGPLATQLLKGRRAAELVTRARHSSSKLAALASVVPRQVFAGGNLGDLGILEFFYGQDAVGHLPSVPALIEQVAPDVERLLGVAKMSACRTIGHAIEHGRVVTFSSAEQVLAAVAGEAWARVETTKDIRIAEARQRIARAYRVIG